jgi:hypothetical protein
VIGFCPRKIGRVFIWSGKKMQEKNEKNNEEWYCMENSLANKISCSAVFTYFSTETLPIEHVITYERDFTDVPRVLL